METSTPPAAPKSRASKIANDRLTRWIGCGIAFALAFFVLFLTMPRYLNVYDESFMLTGALRINAGELPYRDFYAIYGPAEYYALAGLFKLFGPSVLAERLFDFTVEALIVAAAFAIVYRYSNRWMAAFSALIAFLWLVGFQGDLGSATMPVDLLNLVTAAVLLPLLIRRVSTGRVILAGILTGLAFLFRFDAGIGLLLVEICVIAFSFGMRSAELRSSKTDFAKPLLCYLSGFALVVVPAAICFLRQSSFYPVLLDVVILQGKYYRHYRNLPFPYFEWMKPYKMGVYLPILALCGCLYSLWLAIVRSRAGSSERGESSQLRTAEAFLISFGLLAAAMYLKGIVRVSVFHMMLSILPSTLIAALLFYRRKELSSPFRIFVTLLFLSFGAVSLASAARGEFNVYRTSKSLFGYLNGGFQATKSSDELSLKPFALDDWCRQRNPVTRGYCFVSDPERLEAISFIANHTGPDQRILVGVRNHQRVFANDNLIYFASERLPATKWSEYDAGMQSNHEVQADMIQDLNRTVPPYVILDAEFEDEHEPNDSSKSTGVTILDDYIHSNYTYLRSFGYLELWRRKS